MCFHTHTHTHTRSASRRGIDRREDNVKEIKGSYERQLLDLRAELKSLKTARKEHAKAMRKNVRGQGFILRGKLSLSPKALLSGSWTLQHVNLGRHAFLALNACACSPNPLSCVRVLV